MPKMLIDAEEAKQVLLAHYLKSNPDVTEVVIEGMITIKEMNKLLAKEPGKIMNISQISSEKVPEVNQIDVGSDVFDRPGTIVEKLSPPVASPNDPAMIALARGLQTVSDDGRVLHIKYHKGENKGYSFELTKGLEERCAWCGYIAMSDKDLNNHKNAYHKDVVSREKAVEQGKLDKAKAAKQTRLAEVEAEKKGWGKGK